MIGRRSVLVYFTNLVGGFVGYVGHFAVPRLMANAEEVLGLIAMGR